MGAAMSLRWIDAGESHGPAMVCILEGIPAGLPLKEETINLELSRRQRGFGSGGRMKIEADKVQILSGVMEHKTIGSPITLVIPNLDHQKWHGKAIPPMTKPRPGHADLVGTVKYGYKDLRPALERASARETVARVAAGAVCKLLLAQFKIKVGGYVCAIGSVEADLTEIPLEARSRLAEANEVRCPDEKTAERMVTAIQQAMQARDTLGGWIEIVALGLPPGLGSYTQSDRRLDARLGAAILSVQAMKGVEIGPAFSNARRIGSQVQDAILPQGDSLIRPTNFSGGLEGGVTTGQPLILRAAMKPIATTLTAQETVDLHAREPAMSQYERSDFCPVPRAVPVLEAAVALVLADALLEKLGGDSLDEMRPRFEKLRQARFSDLSLDDNEHIYWP